LRAFAGVFRLAELVARADARRAAGLAFAFFAFAAMLPPL
jgi:hypothetical protein